MVDWLIEVALEFRLSDDSLFLAVALLDRLFASMPAACEKRDAQLMAEVCLLIASKVCFARFNTCIKIESNRHSFSRHSASFFRSSIQR